MNGCEYVLHLTKEEAGYHASVDLQCPGLQNRIAIHYLAGCTWDVFEQTGFATFDLETQQEGEEVDFVVASFAEEIPVTKTGPLVCGITSAVIYEGEITLAADNEEGQPVGLTVSG